MKWEKWLNADAGPVRRVDSVDLFRFIVLFFMIQGHLFRAYLLPAVRQEPWFRFHELFHGFVAPGFLFVAGFAAFLSFHNKRQNYLRLDLSFVRRLRRILFVIAVGYWIHLPFFSLRKTLAFVSRGQAGDFLKADILQCIGVGLLLFTLLAALLKNERAVALAAAVAGALFFLLPEVTKTIRLHPFVDPYLDYRVSMFPLFPWLGFLCLGIVAAFLYVRMEKEQFFLLLLIAGLLLFPWFFFFSRAGVTRTELFWSGVLNKIGAVFLLLCLCDLLLRRWRGPFLDLLKRAGSESLFVYVLHLFIIFSSVFGRGLKPLFAGSLTVFPALLLFLAVQLVVFALALLYHHLKERRPLLWRWGFRAFWTLFLLLFFLRRH